MDAKDPTDRIHYRTTDHFLKKNFDKGFRAVIETSDKRSKITDIQLEVSGYGVFDKKTILENFFQYLFQIMATIKDEKMQVKSFKVTIGGFSFKNTENRAREWLYRFIGQLDYVKQFLKLLHIHTANLEDVTLKDFQKLLHLSVELSQINFQQFSLQCSNWTFQGGQPKQTELKQSLESFIGEATSIRKIQNKKFRLEMSGWYYTEREALNFLNPNNSQNINQKQLNEDIQGFHVNMESFVTELLNGMNYIEDFELDMRNWNDILKMKSLKKKLDNVSKEDRREVSIMSKRKGQVEKEDDEQKQLRITITM